MSAGSSRLPAETQVLVAGGGPVGLATALELGQRGIHCVVVEPRREVSHARPRCKTVNVRTMAHLRRWGLADRFRERAPLALGWSQDVAFCTSLTGHELSRFHGVFGLLPGDDRFPEPGQQAPQYVLEELLRDAVNENPVTTLVTGARVTGIEQDPDRVAARIALDDGTEAEIDAEYVVGCDGPRSVVREQICSAYVGETALRPNFGMVFSAPGLLERTAHAPAVQYWIIQDQAPSMLGPIDLHGTWWMIAFGVEQERGRRQGRQLIEQAIGAGTDVEILSTDPWTAHMQLVDRAACGRVFLAGDAAHLNPPFGGHGLNTGIGDSVDLGWKLAATLDGWAGPGLLESYETERRPVQEQVIAAATENMSTLSIELLAADLDAETAAGARARAAVGARIQKTKHSEFHSLELVLGTRHAGSPVIADGGQLLEHVWLDGHSSIYDLLGHGMTIIVLSGSAGPAASALEQACRERRVPVTLLDLSDDSAEERDSHTARERDGHDLRGRYGHDLLLVRPDQHVAWQGNAPLPDPGRIIDIARGAS